MFQWSLGIVDVDRRGLGYAVLPIDLGFRLILLLPATAALPDSFEGEWSRTP